MPPSEQSLLLSKKLINFVNECMQLYFSYVESRMILEVILDYYSVEGMELYWALGLCLCLRSSTCYPSPIFPLLLSTSNVSTTSISYSSFSSLPPMYPPLPFHLLPPSLYLQCIHHFHFLLFLLLSTSNVSTTSISSFSSSSSSSLPQRIHHFHFILSLFLSAFSLLLYLHLLHLLHLHLNS